MKRWLVGFVFILSLSLHVTATAAYSDSSILLEKSSGFKEIFELIKNRIQGPGQTSGEENASEKEADASSEQKEPDEFQLLMERFYKSFDEADFTTLRSLVSDLDPEDEIIIQNENEVIESRMVKSVHIKPGMADDSYIIYSTIYIKYRDYTSTVPTLSLVYSNRDSDGNLIIDGAAPFKPEIREYIGSVNQSEDIAELSRTVNEEKTKVFSDPANKDLVDFLRNMSLSMGNTSSNTEDNRLNIAFGLFSVNLPEGVTAGSNTGNALSDFRFETDGNPQLIYANFALLDDYESSARTKLDSYLSLIYTIAGENYSETEIQEETLESGMRLRWQFMRGSSVHALWFEAFDESFAFNMCMQCRTEIADDDALLTVMRSFRADPERERDLLELRQTTLPEGRFISVEHGLEIQLTNEWEPVTSANFHLPGTAFILEKDFGRWMIQLLCTWPADAEDTRNLLDSLLQRQGILDKATEPSVITLQNLGGIDALVSEVDGDVNRLNVAFVHEGYGYYGLFMWVADDDAEARPFMKKALQTIRKP